MLKAVIDHIINAQPPCVIGLHGDWGAGKSSFLLQLEAVLSNGSQRQGESLEGTQRLPKQLSNLRSVTATHPVVWFEAWKYQNDDQPIITLLQTIRTQLSPSHRVRQKLVRGGLVVAETALAGFDGITKYLGIKINPKDIREVSERHTKDNLDALSFTSSATKLLENAIDTILKTYEDTTSATRVVVLIDDLDRCEPEMARHLLQGLKVFLSLKNVIFVIAMDESIIIDFVASPVGPLEKLDPEALNNVRRKARQYLEKICQAVYRLPFPSQPHNLFCKYLRDLQVSKGIVDKLSDILSAANAIPPNPRKIKMLATETSTNLNKLKALAHQPVAYDPADSYALAYILAYCATFEPHLYRKIQSYRLEIFSDWLLPLCHGVTLPHGFEDLVLPREMRLEPTFPDPVQSGIFYPARLLKNIPSITTDQLKVFLD